MTKDQHIEAMLRHAMMAGMLNAADIADSLAKQTQNLQEQMALKRFATALREQADE